MLGLVCGLQAKRRPETSATTRTALRPISGSSIYSQRGKAAYWEVYDSNEVRYRIRPPGSAAQPARPTQLFTGSLPFTGSCEKLSRMLRLAVYRLGENAWIFRLRPLQRRKASRKKKGEKNVSIRSSPY
jgi:hypothetical protein